MLFLARAPTLERRSVILIHSEFSVFPCRLKPGNDRLSDSNRWFYDVQSKYINLFNSSSDSAGYEESLPSISIWHESQIPHSHQKLFWKVIAQLKLYRMNAVRRYCRPRRLCPGVVIHRWFNIRVAQDANQTDRIFFPFPLAFSATKYLNDKQIVGADPA